MSAAKIGPLSAMSSLIAAHINATAEHERLFRLQDWHLVAQTIETAALDPLDDVLVALCAARPTTPREQWLRQKYLASLKIADKINGCRGLTESVLEALIGPEPAGPIPDASEEVAPCAS
ncbi:hypothetical protein [Mesorhizobium sp.]|uniref:hypothetical protein n=1 Tax=Mesorhizobium sp. TaxID=1871066 RepID=UPI000FE6396F|nr:hypothetical protein [Mesorhizobium sp.]RWO95097.1 MAG: hypothetical protein EOQ97_31565 [Mesorhizobium sp.]